MILRFFIYVTKERDFQIWDENLSEFFALVKKAYG